MFMKTILIIFLSFVLVAILWRLGSKRHLLPCPSWLGLLVELDNPFAKEHHANVIVQHLKLKRGMVVVDIGCGTGRVTIPLAHTIGSMVKVVAMDVQTDMLKKVKAKAKGLKNIEYLHSKAGDGRLEKSKYDRALLVTVLGEIPNQEAALKEIFNALKPDSILSITETIFDPHYQRLSKVRELARRTGFKEKKVFGKWFAYTIHLQN